MKSCFAIVIIACIVCAYGFVLADTTWVTPTTISSEVHWTKTGNPYILKGGVEVLSGGALVIESGVQVYFDTGSYTPTACFKVDHGGLLIAEGTTQDSIIFIPRYTGVSLGNINVEGVAQFRFCKFTHMFSQSALNTAYGGAIQFCESDSGCLASHCSFIDNQATLGGGAIGMIGGTIGRAYADIENCLFKRNFCGLTGGAITLFSGSIINIIGNTFDSNYFDTDNICTMGGAIHINMCEPITRINIRMNIFKHNVACQGAAVCGGAGGISDISNNLFYHNHALKSGGALTPGAVNTINNNTMVYNISDSLAGAIGVEISGLIDFLDDPLQSLKNNIIFYNEAPYSPQIHGSSYNITYSNIQGGYPGTGNIDIDPQFVNAAAGDFHLSCSSPCIDAGDPASALDPDYTTADMGAYYYHHLNGSGDANNDCQVIGSDVTYLVRYFKGLGPTPSPVWRGDASGDTLVAGADVTYLVRYLKGIGNPPVHNPNCSNPAWSIPDTCDPCGY